MADAPPPELVSDDGESDVFSPASDVVVAAAVEEEVFLTDVATDEEEDSPEAEAVVLSVAVVSGARYEDVSVLDVSFLIKPELLLLLLLTDGAEDVVSAAAELVVPTKP